MRDTEPQEMGIEEDEAMFKWHTGTGLSPQKKVTNLSMESNFAYGLVPVLKCLKI